jgi:hypothetical protein
LLQVLVSMTGSVCPAWHIVKVIDTFDIKRDMAGVFYKSEIAARVMDFWKLNYLTVT